MRVLVAPPSTCPHCGLKVNIHMMDLHLRDTGGVRTPLGCKVLFAKRERN